MMKDEMTIDQALDALEEATAAHVTAGKPGPATEVAERLVGAAFVVVRKVVFDLGTIAAALDRIASAH